MAHYRILCDGHPLMDTRLNEYTLIGPECTLELNKTGSLSFDIAPDHPYYDTIHKVSSVITLVEGSEIVFRGRVMDDDVSFDKIKHVECEGELAYLLDSIVRPYTYQGTVAGLMALYIESHNEQVERKKRFSIGSVTVTDANDYITRAASAYPTTWAELNDKCLDLMGGYVRLRHVGDETYIDYVENFGNVNQQVIDFGQNILDLSKYVKGADVATRIIPLGAKLDNDGAQGEEKRLTIEGINGGVDYVEDADAIELYGVITKIATFDDVTTETALLQRGYSALAAQKLLQVTLEINAIDLHFLKVDVERIKLGDMIKVRSKPHSIDEYMMVSKVHMVLDDVASSTITLGATFATLTNETKDAAHVQRDIESIKSDYVSSGVLSATKDQISSNVESQITQSADEIVSIVRSEYAQKGDVESLNEDLASRIEQTAEDLQFTFDRATLYTEQVDGEIRSIIEQIMTYYRFDEDGALIGKSGSPFETRIDNQELGFYQNGQRVAYFSNLRLYVKDVEVYNVLTIGNYEIGYWDWKPRANGNLSLKWRGGASQ